MRYAWLLVGCAVATACSAPAAPRSTPVPRQLGSSSPPPAARTEPFTSPAVAAAGDEKTRRAAPSIIASADELAALRHRPLLALYDFAEARSDPPAVLALYEDGLVLFERVVGDHLSRFSVRWTPERVAELADRWVATLDAAPPAFDVTRQRHHGSVEILFRRGSVWSARYAYGFDRRAREILPHPAERALTPEEQGLRDVYAAIVAFDAPDARPWVAEDVELTLWGGEQEPGGTPWPRHLPPLPSAETLEKPRVRGHRHVVPGRHEQAIVAFLDRFPGPADVRHEGRRFGVRYRPHAPDELHVLTIREALREQMIEGRPPR